MIALKNKFLHQLVRGAVINMVILLIAVLAIVLFLAPGRFESESKDYLKEVAEYINEQNIYLLLVDDPVANQELVESFNKIPALSYASITNIDTGSKYKTGQTEWEDAPDTDDRIYYTTRNQIHLKQPIFYDPTNPSFGSSSRDKVGYLHIALERSPQNNRLWLLIKILLGSAFAGFLLNLPFIFRYSKKLSDPISSLANQISQLDVTQVDKRQVVLENAPEELKIIETSVNDQMQKFSGFHDAQERQIEERTADLNQALTRAEVAEHSKSALMANLSHDLKTPLTSVKGFIELSHEEILYGDKKSSLEALKSATKSVNRLEKEVKILLQFSSKRHAEYNINIQKIDINNLVQERLTLAEPFKRESNNVVTYQHKGNKYIYSDPYYLEHAIDNLISNAHKFCRDGDVTIRTNIHEGQFEFMITDTGIGIEKEKLDHIFKKHYQIDTERSTGNQGDGLGLTLAKEWIAMLGGEVVTASILGEHTTFTIILPDGDKEK